MLKPQQNINQSSEATAYSEQSTFTNHNSKVNHQTNRETNDSAKSNQTSSQSISLVNIQSTVTGYFAYIQDKYKEYQDARKQKMYTFPEAKTYPSKQHLLKPQQIANFDFSKLNQEELNMLQDLSTFTPHREFVKMLQNKYSNMKGKEHFIKEHSSTLSSDQFAMFNQAKFQYEKNSMAFATISTGSLTLAGLLVGLWVLPARKSPWKYSFIGLGMGLGLSYGFWRFQIYRYHTNMNDQFRVIMKSKYQNEKKSQQLKLNSSKQVI